MSEWETFCDECYYHLWRVRRKTERGFNDGFHVQNREDAEALVELLNRLERERDEARKEAEYYKERYEQLKDERDRAREALMDIEEVFVDGDDTYEDWKKMGSIARTYCESWI